VERINVVGTSCSGKTTLARSLATRLRLRYVELDALFWGPNWTPVPDETFRSRVERAASGDRWVIDGGYAKLRPVTWSRADTIVWLDYPMPLVLGRWARRTAGRIRSGEEFWPGTQNRESLRKAFRSDGLLWWILRTHRSRRSRTSAALVERPDLRVVRLRSPRETEEWLATLPE
jgi:adenylate kinase family enzyme